MAKQNTTEESQLAELVSIKRLLIFSLLRSGASQREVAAALGTDQSQVSRMFPKPSGPERRPVRGRK